MPLGFSTALKTQMRVTTHMIMATQLLRLSGNELRERVERELAENPMLGRQEAVDKQPPPPRDKPSTFSISSPPKPARPSTQSLHSFDDVLEFVVAGIPAREQLAAQLRLRLANEELTIGLYLIQLLDAHGYLTMPLETVAQELGVARPQVEAVLLHVQTLDPPGIGARNAHECLLIQCRHLQEQNVACGFAPVLLESAWKEIEIGRWDRAAQKVGCSQEELKKARQFMVRNLYPYPLNMISEASDREHLLYRVDLKIHLDKTKSEARLWVEIPESDEFNLQVFSPTEATVIQDGRFDSLASEGKWGNQWSTRARLFIAALHQRWSTLYRIGNFLVENQRDFFVYGEQALKPTTRIEVAQALDMHESTISRAVADKILQLPSGRLIKLEALFNTSRATSEAIAQVLAHSDRALTDHEIAEQLQAKGISIARRTVAKYRKSIGLGSSRYSHSVALSYKALS